MRVKGGFTSRRRHKKILKLAEGFKGRRSKCYKLAKRSVQKSLRYSFRDRRARKRDFRSLWITRINAATRSIGLKYSLLVRGLRRAKVEIDRKILADLAISQPQVFADYVNRAKAALAA